MTYSCDHNREHMTAEAAHARPWSEAVELHLAECQACTSWAARLQLHVRALGELPSVAAPHGLRQLVDEGFEESRRGLRAVAALRSLSPQEAPADLDGRVVAAMHGGKREQRAISELRSFGSQSAPAELDRRMEDLFVELRGEGQLPAIEVPGVLEARVDEDLRNLPQSITRRLLSKLERVPAPSDLRTLVEADLTGSAAPRTILRFTQRRALLAGLAAAACLVLWVGVSGPGGGPASAVRSDLVVIPGSSSSEFSPRARELADRLSGGALSALRLAGIEGQAPELGLASAAGSDAPQRVPLRGARAAQTQGAVNTNTTGSGAGRSTSQAAPGSAGSTAPGSAQQRTGGGVPLLDLVGSAPLTTAFRGVRRIAQVAYIDGNLAEIDYREEIATDGRGHFTIQPGEVLSPQIPAVELEQFQLLQSGREGFFFRSRDFSIRNLELFEANYGVVDLGQQMDIVGVTVSLFDISRLDGRGNLFHVGIDPATGIILHEVEIDQAGHMVRSMKYESFAYGADLSDIELSGGPSPWVPFDLDDSDVLGPKPLRPTAPPSGFAFLGAGISSNYASTGADWAQLTYGDGVEQVFFAYSLADPSEATQAPSGQIALGTQEGDGVRVLTFGAWTMVEGLVRGTEVIAVGKVHEAELLLMIQSALETR